MQRALRPGHRIAPGAAPCGSPRALWEIAPHRGPFLGPAIVLARAAPPGAAALLPQCMPALNNRALGPAAFAARPKTERRGAELDTHCAVLGAKPCVSGTADRRPLQRAFLRGTHRSAHQRAQAPGTFPRWAFCPFSVVVVLLHPIGPTHSCRGPFAYSAAVSSTATAPPPCPDHS